MSLEAENGFKNLLGRNENFHSFISRELLSVDEKLLSLDLRKLLTQLSNNFVNYPSANESQRRRFVIDTRKALYDLSRKYEPLVTIKPPKLRLSNGYASYSKTLNNRDHSLSLESPISNIKGIGVKSSAAFTALGLFVVRDLLLHYPRDYIDYSSLKRINSLKGGETATIVATVRRSSSFTSPRNQKLSVLEIHLQDVTGRMKITRFFIGRRFSNRSYLRSQVNLYPVGATLAVSGLVKEGPYGKSFNNPIIEVLDNSYSEVKSETIGRLIPVYSLCDGLTADRFRKAIKCALPLASHWCEPLDKNRLSHLSLMSISNAMSEIHLPRDQNNLKEARRRIVFDEFFFLQLGLLRKRYGLRKKQAPPIQANHNSNSLTERFVNLLPYDLTRAQHRVLDEITSDLSASEPMARLLQGDVGSGKTVVAILALLYAVESGWQGALMAPTEVLAQQHYRNLNKWMPQLNVTVEILTGSTTPTRRRQTLNDLSTGNLNILVGTHALIEDPVAFSRLGLVVVDEQHRFGVNQRNLLLDKGLQPHLLTMTATPIPRTLALSIHGDLDVSQIDELPPGRTKIKTKLLSNSRRQEAYALIKSRVLKGEQVYFVLPLVEESEKIDLRSAVDVHQEFDQEVFKDFNVGLLHGRMKSHEKDQVVRNFISGEINVLVSTTVIEVGVDVANATLMVIDHADRFGLAQLHQLRGRVGRGSKSSECLLIGSDKKSPSRKKLEYLVASNDGFEISEIDMRLRGPGQVLGTKQSGLPDFALASLIEDSAVLELAREEALYILDSDPELSHHQALRKMLDEHWDRFVGNAQLN